jgi:hypothetical protein
MGQFGDGLVARLFKKANTLNGAGRGRQAARLAKCRLGMQNPA